MTKALNSSFEVSEVELQSRYYVHFQTNNTLGKAMKLHILLVMSEIVSLLFFYKYAWESFQHRLAGRIR